MDMRKEEWIWATTCNGTLSSLELGKEIGEMASQPPQW